jgi:uncharacterized protein YcfJ
VILITTLTTFIAILRGASIMKTLMIAMTVSLTTGLAVTQQALADYDSVGAALFGGVAGAVIGGAVGGRNGAAIGAAIGGITGATASSQSPQYQSRQYDDYPPAYARAPVRTTYYTSYTPVTYYPVAQPATYYSTTYYPAYQEAYPVRQVTYYRNEYRDHPRNHRYSHDHGWRRDRYERYDRYDRGY